MIQASSPILTAIFETLAATLPGHGGLPFILNEDFNIAQGLIRKVGFGKIVRRDKVPPLAADVIVQSRKPESGSGLRPG